MSSQPEQASCRVSGGVERNLLSWSLLAALALLAGLAMPFFAGRIYLGDDLGNFHMPARAFYADQLARHESFDWMPSLFSGFYLTGEGQAGCYHPVYWLLFRLLPFRVALGWEYLASYPFMLLGMWLFLVRRLRRRDAAMLGSLLFTFSSFNLLHFVHPGAVATIAHIPWLLAAIDVVLIDASRIRVATAQAILALLTGSQILLGCLQFVWFSLLIETGYVIFLLVTRRFVAREGCVAMLNCGHCVGCGRSTCWRVIVAKGLGILLGAVQWLPIVDAFIHGRWQATDSTVTEAESLHPLNLVQLIAPYLSADRAFGDNARELSLYVGAVPLMLVVWVIVRRRALGNLRSLACVAGGLAAAGVLLAVGDFTEFRWLRSALPIIGWFRYGCRYTVLLQFAVAVLAAIGFVLLEREGRQFRKMRACSSYNAADNNLWKRFEPFWAVVLVSLAVALAGCVLQRQRYVAPLSHVLAGPLFLATAAILVIASARAVRGALIALILFAAADLGFYGLSRTLADPSVRPEGLMASIESPPSDPAGGIGGESSGNAAQRANRGVRTVEERQSPDAADRQSDHLGRLEPRGRLRRTGAAAPTGLLSPAGASRGLDPLGPTHSDNDSDSRSRRAQRGLA